MDADNKRRRPHPLRPPHQQQGVVLVMVTIAMVVLLLAGAMALDVGHLTLNKGRFQNMVDAAALSAAKTLDISGDTVLAEASAMATLNQNNSQPGNSEVTIPAENVLVEFSDVLPFDPTTASADSLYVRVTVSDVPLQPFLMQVMALVQPGEVQKNMGASAVAGPSSSLYSFCNVVPMMVCQNSTVENETIDGKEYYWGYGYGDIEVLKMASNTEGELDGGNFQLIRLDGAAGGADIRSALAGDYEACMSLDGEPGETTVPTEPGNTVGPVVQGLNTRFGQYQGGQVNPDDHPADLITTQTDPRITVDGNNNPVLPAGYTESDLYTYDDYENDYTTDANIAACSTGTCDGYERRILGVPIGDCSGKTNGQNDIPLQGMGCFYLMQDVEQSGNEAYVVGQFIGKCEMPNGNPGVVQSVNGPYRIQLYKDPASGDS